MKKIVIIPISVVVFIGIAAVAAGILFPDSSPFTRMPIGPGTLGQTLTGAFDANGNALNANMLSGVSANDYLKDKDCSGEPIDNVWVAVDGSGKGRCGHLGGVLADLSIGSIGEFYGTVNVYRSGSVTPIAAGVGMPLYEGDVVDTAANGTGTIMFAADNSLLRLNTNTNVELKYGLLDGKTVAEVILSDGRLWGRIITGTGINLGGGGVVTGVRGTSVDLQKIGGEYVINIINSTSEANAVKPVAKTTSLGGVKTLSMAAVPAMASVMNDELEVQPVNFGAQKMLKYTEDTVNITIMPKVAAQAYSDDMWIKNNTEADIKYMSDTLSGGALSPAKEILMKDELDSTIGFGNIPVLKSFISGGDVLAGDLIAAATILDSENAADGFETTDDVFKRMFKRLTCKKADKTYIKDKDRCDGSHYKTLAVSDFQAGEYNTSLNIFGSKGKYNYSPDGGSNRYYSPNTNKIKYTGASFPELVGKVITIHYAAGASLVDGKYIADFDTAGRMKYDTNPMYNAQNHWKIYNGDMTYISSSVPSTTGAGWVKFKINSNPGRFIVGNEHGQNENLGRTIESIEISND